MSEFAIYITTTPRQRELDIYVFEEVPKSQSSFVNFKVVVDMQNGFVKACGSVRGFFNLLVPKKSLPDITIKLM